MVKQQLFIGAALIAGAAIGYFAAPAGEPSPAAVETEKADRPRTRIEDRGAEASLEALRARIRELESALAAKAEREETAVGNQGENEQPRMPMPGEFRNRREWAENFRKANPEAYTQMTNGIARWRQNRLQRQQERYSFFSSIDTSSFSSEARQTHQSLLDALARREELEAQFEDENLSMEDHVRLAESRRQFDREINRLYEEERGNLLSATAKELGLQGEDAEALRSTVEEIYRATESRGGWGRPGGGQRPDGPRGGGQRRRR